MLSPRLKGLSRIIPCSLIFCAYAVCAVPVGQVTPASFVAHAYDYLIVGGGTAGLVVAARLSENPKVTVGVIEAGLYRPNDPIIDDPAVYATAQSAISSGATSSAVLANYDWEFFTTPQVGLGGRRISEDRGKVLGGSSAINAFAFQRASAEEYDAWGRFFGNGEDWTWQNIEPYFKKVENWTAPPIVYPGEVYSSDLSAAHGKNGPLKVAYNNYFADELKKAVAAAANLGIPFNNDPDSGNATDFVNVARTVDPVTGNRTYSAPAYYAPFMNRPNYVVLTGAEATQIVFSSHGGYEGLVATGVKFVAGNQTYTVNATREVILSAGPLKSPQLLELSGIGNRTLLSSLGIKTLVDLPYVGENFIDHTIVFSDHVLDPGQQTLDELAWNQTYAAQQALIYETTRKGPYSYSSAAISVVPPQKVIPADALAQMASTLNSTLRPRTPLIALQYQHAMQALVEGRIGWGVVVAWPGGGQISKQANGTSYLGTHVLNYRPFSRGSVHINTTSPLAAPLINPDFLGVQFDADFCAQELAFTQKWAATTPLKEIVAGPNTPPAGSLSLSDLETYCREVAITTWHPMGTTAMAPLAMGGVVSNKLKVHGLANVRVVDSGVFPNTIGAALQATTYMVAEKASDIIKNDQ